jgi:hypothetical protein
MIACMSCRALVRVAWLVPSLVPLVTCNLSSWLPECHTRAQAVKPVYSVLNVCLSVKGLCLPLHHSVGGSTEWACGLQAVCDSKRLGPNRHTTLIRGFKRSH